MKPTHNKQNKRKNRPIKRNSQADGAKIGCPQTSNRLTSNFSVVTAETEIVVIYSTSKRIQLLAKILFRNGSEQGN